MKKITIHKLLLWVLLFFIGNSLFAQQQIDFTLKYNTSSSEYEVYARPLLSGNFPTGGGSQLTVILPASAPNTTFATLASVQGGPWTDQSQLYAPPAQPANDFHVVSTNGTAADIAFVAGQEKLIFKFTLSGGCTPGVRLYRNAVEGAEPRDPASSAQMFFVDCENYFAPVTTANQEYNANYNNTGTSCAPAATPDLITSIGQPAPSLVAGSPSTVPVTITNIGTGPTTSPINTTITLPTGTSAPPSFSSNGHTCTTTGQTVSCDNPTPLSNIAPTNTSVIEIPVTAAPSTVNTAPGPFTAVPSTVGETTTANNPATPMTPTTPVSAAPAPDLVTVIGQPATPFVAGQPSSVPVTVTNQGTAPANGPINTTITLPTGFSAPATFATPVGTTCNTNGQIVMCSSTGPLNPNNTIAISVPVTPDATTVGSTPPTTATTSAPNEPASNTTNNPATPMSPTTPVSGGPDLVTTIGTVTPSMVAGQSSNLPVTVTNQGTTPTTGTITTTITLPNGVTPTNPTFTSNGFFCSTNVQVVTCTSSTPISNVTPTNTAQILVPITPSAAIVGNTPPFNATSGGGGEPAANTGNNPAPPTTSGPVSAAPAPDLVTTIGQPATPFVAGQPSSVPVTVTNQGTAPANGPINTTITLPTGFSAPATFATPAGTTCNTNGQIVTCSSTGPLNPNNTIAISVPVTPAASTVGVTPTPQTTATTAAPNEPVANQTNNPAIPMSPTTPVAAAPAPDLVTTIGTVTPSMVAGQSSNLPVTVTNIGTAPTTGTITTTITLPNGVAPTNPTFTSNGFSCSTNVQVVTCTSSTPISNVQPTNTAQIIVPITPSAAIVGNTPPFNATSGGGGEPATNTGNNPAPPTTSGPVSAAPAPDLVTTIGQPATPFVAGQPSSVPVTVTNIGTAPANGPINTTITLPVGFSAPLTFPAPAGTTCNTNGQIVTCSTTGPLNPNNTIAISVPVTPAASTVGSAPPTTATTSAPNEPASNTTNNPATPMSPTTPVAGGPDLTTTIGTVSPTMVVGTTSNLPVTVTNIGTAPTTGTITSTITLPAGFTTPQSIFVTNGYTCSVNSQTVTCFSNTPLSNVGPSNTNVLQIPVTPSAVNGNTTPTFAATSGGGGEPAGSTGNNPAPSGNAGPVSLAPAPNLTLAIGQPSPSFVVNTPSNVPVTISNIGTASATGTINTTITLPAGFSAPATFATPAGTTCNTNGQTVTCTSAGPLSHTSPNTIVFNIPVTAAPSTVNTAPPFNGNTSVASEPAANTGNNTATMTPSSTVAAAPVADLVTTIGQPSPALVAGQPSNVPVTVTNIGTAPTTGTITTVITLPAGTSAPLTFSSNGNTCNTLGQTITCTNPGPLSTTNPTNSTVINVPVTAAPSTVGQNPGPFNATPSTPGETNTANNGATPMTPTISVTAPVVVNVALNVKVFLQGAYDAATGLMRDDLRTKGFLPLQQPYSAMARTSYHTGTEGTTAAALATTGANAIVDWVLVELRTGAGSATRVATRAALVQRDGDVVDVNGFSPVTFANRAAGNYYVVVTHRNHLGAMSEVAVAMSATPTLVDFTGAYDGYGSHAMKAIGNLNALWAGNANHTGVTHRNTIFSGANNDPDAVKNNVLTTAVNAAFDFSYVPMGYHIGDTNLDGDVKYQGPTNDVDNLIFFNVLSHPGNTTTSPLFLISEQH